MHLSLLSLSKARSPIGLLKLMTFAMPFSFGVWMALFNNFAIEQGGLNGAHIGVLQSWREVPGFLAFGAVFLLVIIAEQRLAIWSLIMLGVGTVLTGWLPSFSGLLVTTMLMSVGFHYYETMKQSLALQWFSKEEAPVELGRLMSIGAASSLLAYGWVWAALQVFHLPVAWVYVFGGGVTIALALIALVVFPQYKSKVPQTKKLILRKRYSLYYALVFMGGGRRQIFVVFAALMMVERFGFGADEVALMFLVNGLLSMWLAPKIGGLVARWGEKRALTVEYIGLILVFLAYSVVEWAPLAVLLYLLDHVLFAMAIAQKTYFQKIADPADMASTAGVSFTINHIAAVVLPALMGLLWLVSPSWVFILGALMAAISLMLARWVPSKPTSGKEWQNPFSAKPS
jgi:MFS family permease|tara:strand:- start:24571 stop:25770 length:1200 start_codon:yes stop_codon:yes gene_type:complete